MNTVKPTWQELALEYADRRLRQIVFNMIELHYDTHGTNLSPGVEKDEYKGLTPVECEALLFARSELRQLSRVWQARARTRWAPTVTIL